MYLRNQPPDPRISKSELGTFRGSLDRYLVVHAFPGCPRNACIELFDGYLRCWACHRTLDDAAQDHVLANHTLTDKRTFSVQRNLRYG